MKKFLDFLFVFRITTLDSYFIINVFHFSFLGWFDDYSNNFTNIREYGKYFTTQMSTKKLFDAMYFALRPFVVCRGPKKWKDTDQVPMALDHSQCTKF